MFLPHMAYSDMPENIDILVMPATSDSFMYKNYIDNYFRKLAVDKELGRCNGNIIKVGSAYINKHPKNINNEILLRSLTDKKSKALLIQILEDYSDDNTNGFGGVFFYYIKGDVLALNATSIANGITIENKISLNDVSNLQRLSQEICSTILPLPLIGE